MQRDTVSTDAAGAGTALSLVQQPFFTSIVRDIFECTFCVDRDAVCVKRPGNSLQANRTLLHEAIESGDVPLLEEVVKMGAALDYPCEATDPMYPKGCTPLLHAVIKLTTGPAALTDSSRDPAYIKDFVRRHLAALELLLAYGADTEQAMPRFSAEQLLMGRARELAVQLWNRTPLQIAALFADVKVASVLLRYGADPDVPGGPSLQSLWGKGLPYIRSYTGGLERRRATDELQAAFTAGAAAAPEGGPARVHVGSRALLQGLVSAAELNGQRCQILMFDKEKQRWQVRVDGSGKEVSVAEAKLQPLVTPWRYVDRRCRCGSGRLLSECHGPPDQADLVRTTKVSCGDGHPLLSLSPGAPCPCFQGSEGKPVKPCGRCCWKRARWFMDDRAAKCTQQVQRFGQEGTAAGKRLELMQRFHEMRRTQGTKQANQLFPGGEHFLKNMLDLLACPDAYNEWIVEAEAPYQRPRTAAVYVGVLRRIPNWFLWVDAHWRLPTPELLVQVEEWNREVEVLAQERGMVGEERDRFLTEMGASPFAPCGNPKCLALETKVKGHKKCNGCNAIAYCSVDCQRQHWRAPGTESHKTACAPIETKKCQPREVPAACSRSEEELQGVQLPAV